MIDYAKEYGDWVSAHHWTHWVHLTIDPKVERRERRQMVRFTPDGLVRRTSVWTLEPFRRSVGRAGVFPRTVEGVAKAFVDRFIRYCTKLVQQRVPFVYVVESGGSGSNPHIHALIAETEAISCARLAEVWRHGRAQVSIYDTRKNGATYLAKEAGRPDFEWGVSKTLIRRADHPLIHVPTFLGRDER